jgi:hypothetical protein
MLLILLSFAPSLRTPSLEHGILHKQSVLVMMKEKLTIFVFRKHKNCLGSRIQIRFRSRRTDDDDHLGALALAEYLRVDRIT